jgi:hypothetical protein
MLNWFFDGDLMRIYEVPPDSSFILDGDGYRIYTPDDIPSAPSLLYTDIQTDLWSRWVDWNDTAKWSWRIFNRSGGASRGFDQYGQEKFQSVDFNLLASMGWRFVLSNYPHETRFIGNLYSDSAAELFDYARITSIPPPIPRYEGAADLLTYQIVTGSGLSVAQAEQLSEMYDLLSVIEDGYSHKDIMRILGSVLAGKVSGAGTGVEIFKGVDGLTDRVVSSVDANGNRASVTLDVS